MRRLLATLLLLVGLLPPCAAAVTVDAACTTNNGAISSPVVTAFAPTAFIAVSGGLTNSVFVGFLIQTGGATPITNPAMTWNGSSMTLLTTATSPTTGTAKVFLFGIRAPASGTNTQAATWTNAAQVEMGGCAFQGVVQTSDGAAFINSTTATGTSTGASSITVTSPTGDVAFAATSISSFSSISAVNGTQVWLNNTGAVNDGSANFLAGSGSAILTATIASSIEWATAGIDLAASTGGAATSPRLMLLGVGP